MQSTVRFSVVLCAWSCVNMIEVDKPVSDVSKL
jgi:hypothetical protein